MKAKYFNERLSVKTIEERVKKVSFVGFKRN